MHRKTSFFIIALITISLFAVAVYGQQKPYEDVVIASPNAASLGKYTDIPVNYHTGIPQISIPFYTVKEGPLSLSIGISYHAGGIKVMEPASWIGTGWSLNAGGAVMRSVRGAPDEQGTSKTLQGHFTDYGYSSYPMYGGGGPPQSTGPNVPYDAGFANGIYDGEPDLYTFNFEGYSGKFYFRDDRTPIMVPQQDLKIEPYFLNGGTMIEKNIRGFIITVPDGTKYYFGTNADGTPSGSNPVETTFPYSQGNTNQAEKVISSWFLSKIVSGDNRFSIQLSYETEEYGYHTFSMFPISSDYQPSMDPTNNPYEYLGVKNFVSGVRLQKITFSNGEVNFIPGSLREDLCGVNAGFQDNANMQSYTLSSIQIKDLQTGGNCRSFDFSYSYFSDNTGTNLPGQLLTMFANVSVTTDKKRLKLNSIQEHSCDNTVILPPYTFTYATDFLPRRLSFAQDHWGFYNGATGNSTLIPTYTVNNSTTVGGNRDCNEDAMYNGILTKITYPTGGSTEYGFEPNSVTVHFPQTNLVQFGYDVVGYTSTTATPANPVSTSTTYRNLEAGNYIFYLSSSTGGSDASFFLYGGGGQTIFSLAASPGQTVSYAKNNLPAGTYQFVLKKDLYYAGTTSSSVGASASSFKYVTNIVVQNPMAGGLRIKSITQKDGIATANDIITSYSYGDENSAVLYSRPRYLQVLRNDELSVAGFAGNNTTTNLYPQGCVTVGGPGYTFPYFKSPVGISPLSTVQGYHIGYKEVKVSQTGNGYSIYRYYGSGEQNIADVAIRSLDNSMCSFDIPNWPAAPLPFDYQRGELKYEGHYNEDGQALEESDYVYSFDSSGFVTPGYIVKYYPNGPNNYGLLGTRYNLKEYWKRQTQVFKKTISPGNNTLYTSTATISNSPYHFQPVSVTTYNSTNQTVQQKFTYPADYRSASCDAISSCLTDYNNACASCDAAMQSAMASSTNYAQKYIANTDNKICRMYARKDLAACRKENFTKPGSAYQVCMDDALNNADEDLKPLLQQRKMNRMLPVEETVWKDDKLVSASFTKYGYMAGVSSYVYPQYVQSLNVSVPSASFTASSVSGSGLIKDRRYTDEGELQWANGSLVQLQKKDGLLTAYLYGYNNTRPVAKVVGVTYSQVQAVVDNTIVQNPASDAALRTELNAIRTGFPAAMVTTYTYSLNGMTSETAPDGRTTYYEYDVLGRLQDAKDHNGNIIKSYDYRYQQTP